METTGSPRRRRIVTFAGAFALFVYLGGPGPELRVCSAQSRCSLPPQIPVTDADYSKGFKPDQVIPYYIDESASLDEAFQIEAAFTSWQTELAAGGKHFKFSRTGKLSLAKSSGIEIVIGPTPPGIPARFNVVRKDPETFELEAALITIDLRGGPMPGRLYFDPEEPGYEGLGATSGAITKAMMHEVGHALGLHHFAGRACTEQQSGASVMNGMCGINDHGAMVNGIPRPPALADKPAPCDVAAVRRAVPLTRDGGR